MMSASSAGCRRASLLSVTDKLTCVGLFSRIGATESQVLALALNHLYTALLDGGRFRAAGIEAPAADGMLVAWTDATEIDAMLERLREADRD